MTRGAPGYIDSHVHWWDRAVLDYDWLDHAPDLADRCTDVELASEVRDPDPVLGPALGAIVVEAGRRWDEVEDEVDWLVSETGRQVPLLGVVAGLQIELPDAEHRLLRLLERPQVVGVRRLLQDDPPGVVASADVVEGARLLGGHGVPFDVCVRRHQLPEVVQLARSAPETVFVLDHVGKPWTAESPTTEWLADLARLADQPNVVCKLSGLATEGGDAHPSVELLADFLSAALARFGAERCLFGSDWPVSGTRTSHVRWRRSVGLALACLSDDERRAVARGTSERVYGVSLP